MNRTVLEIVIVLLLILANGVFSMSETAVVSSRRARLKQRADEGDAGAQKALALSENPNSFLATVQIGITLVGILSGAFGGATVAQKFAGGLRNVPVLAPYAEDIALAIVVACITYLSLVVGELVPKRIALNNSEGIASKVAGPMNRLSALTSPLVKFLGFSTDSALRLLRVRQGEEPPVTEDEIGVMLEQGALAGVFEPSELAMIESVFELTDERVTAIMTPRPDIVWLDINGVPDETARKISESVYSRFPVCRGDLEDLLGTVRARDLLVGNLAGQNIDLARHLREPLLVPETISAVMVLERFRQSGEHIALVVDEHGGISGLVTLQDVLESIVGEMPSAGEPRDAAIVRRPDGSWLMDGTLPVDELREALQVDELPDEGEFQSLGGFVLKRLERIPVAGDSFQWSTLRFEVVDMDGNRVDKVLITPLGEDGDERARL